jgi:hypothetical protein
MKPRMLLALVAAALLALLAAAWVAGLRAPDDVSPQPGLLAPGLAQALDQVTQVRVMGAGGTTRVTLDRKDGGWGVAERGGYRADAEKLRALLQALASARRVEAKTAVAERHAQLGVEDVAGADARGARVDIVTPLRTYSWVIGDNLVRGTGTYVRDAAEAQSWLINGNIAVDQSAANWLDRQIIDIGANRITAIGVTPAQGPAFSLLRKDDDPASDFAFASLPKGREPAEGYRREALAGVLSGLTFEDVFTARQRPVPETLQVTRFALDDGREVEIRSWPHEGHVLAVLAQRLDADKASQWRARQAERAAGDDAQDAEAIDPAQRVEAFQRAHAGWVYQLPAYKASNLDKPLEDYLQPRP